MIKGKSLEGAIKALDDLSEAFKRLKVVVDDLKLPKHIFEDSNIEVKSYDPCNDSIEVTGLKVVFAAGLCYGYSESAEIKGYINNGMVTITELNSND